MKKILVVDDYSGIREILVEILVGSGYEVKEACNGREGLNLLQRDCFDLVITDIGMPEMRGDEMVRLYDGNIKIIVISGGGDKGAADKLSRADSRVVRFFPKPFDLRELLNFVNKLGL